MILRKASSIVLLLLVVAASAGAQEGHRGRMFLGPIIGGDFGFDRGAIPVLALSTDCGLFTKGTSISPSAGLRLMFPSALLPRLGVIATGSLSFSSSRFSADPVDPIRIFDNENSALIELHRVFIFNPTYWRTDFDLLLSYGVADRLMIAAGGAVRFQLQGKYRETDNVLGPGDYSFRDGLRVHEVTNGSRLTTNRAVVGPTMHVSYGFPIGGGRLLAPEIAVTADLTSPIREAEWRRYSIGGRLALLFDISPVTPIEPPVIAIDSVPARVDPPARPRLSAAISLYSVDEMNRPLSVTKIHVNEVLLRQHAPLIPAIFFDRDSTTFPSRYATLQRREIDSFYVDGLAGLDVLDIQHHSLDVIGSRLRANPSSRLTLFGSASRDERPEVQRARAETVRGYLEKTWGIGRSRIIMKDGLGPMHRSNESVEDGRADNRRAELVTTPEWVMAPVITEQIVRDFDPPIIRMSPTYDAAAGMKQWTITVMQNGDTIARYTDRDAARSMQPELTWRLAPDQIDSNLAPLEAELVVEDSTGATVSARTQVAMTLEKRLQVVDGRVARNGDREQISYMLVGFGYNSSELGKQNEATIRDIAGALRDSASVTIIGYTDRIGEDERNVQLSTQRAERAAAALQSLLEQRGLHGVRIDAAGRGRDMERFENDLQEGRALSRGVGIVVEESTGIARGH
ncbi:MAG: OmpA family protein [Candidatus Kapaibacterium sp.]